MRVMKCILDYLAAVLEGVVVGGEEACIKAPSLALYTPCLRSSSIIGRVTSH